MTWSDIDKLVSAIVWPVVTLVLAFIFRSPISNLIDRLKHFEVAGLKGDFQRRTEAVRDEAESINIEVPASDETTTLLLTQAVSDPWIAAKETWLRVRRAAARAASGSLGDGISTKNRVQGLLTKGYVTPAIYDLTSSLSGIYFAMRASPGAVDPAAATDYVKAGATLVAAL